MQRSIIGLAIVLVGCTDDAANQGESHPYDSSGSTEGDQLDEQQVDSGPTGPADSDFEPPVDEEVDSDGSQSTDLESDADLEVDTIPSDETAPQVYDVDHSQLTYEAGVTSYSISVYEAETDELKPLVILVPGTGEGLDDQLFVAYAEAIASRGFIFAIVDYQRFVGIMDCDALGQKAEYIFGTDEEDLENTAIQMLIENTSVDTTRAVKVMGFSQGSWIVHQAPLFTGDIEVGATLLVATGTHVRMNTFVLNQHLPCNEHEHNNPQRVLAITGESDIVYSIPEDGSESRFSQIQPQLVAVSGVDDCSEMSCYERHANFSYIIVPNDEVTDGIADHMFQKLDEGDEIDSVWSDSEVIWGLRENIEWLLVD